MANEINDYQAYVLSEVLNFAPQPQAWTTGGLQVVEVKYEPDHNEFGLERHMVLAHWFDKTNVIISYSPFYWSLKYLSGESVTKTELNVCFKPQGEYNGQTYWKGSPSTCYLWYNGIRGWYITTSLGVIGSDYWYRDYPSFDGEYEPYGNKTEKVTVSLQLS
jgi:hypothetical protein